MSSILDSFLWWSGAVGWTVFLVTAVPALIKRKPWRRPTGNWYGTAEQRKAVRAAEEEDLRVVGSRPRYDERETDLHAPL